eukprot:CAMPEP_0115244436 /NCGR_PEP_ID=MMETSP0270-20121206/39984_1 /TAXON_ID=71861 /ORGANISM="Scrippsiella trochoidea, Strain CCMP3099" /LENGTH=254 /DNA_ID=CAMNT_0002659567 /DNA_START=70 /DNA_END=835 /DNA_ORIENTATION=-
MARVSGTVKFFNTDKGYGFILGPASKEESKVESEDKKEGEEESKEESQQQDKQQEYFVHFSAIEGEGFKSLASGEVVEYELELNPSTGKMCAVRVTGPGGAPVQGAPPQMKGGACGGGKGGKGMKGGFPGMMPFPDACGGKGFGGGGKSGGKKGGKGKGKGGKGKGFNGFGDQAYMYGGDALDVASEVAASLVLWVGVMAVATQACLIQELASQQVENMAASLMAMGASVARRAVQPNPFGASLQMFYKVFPVS